MLTAHHIHKAYNLNTILEDVSFSIRPGDRVGLIGPNGSGKTTLLRVLAGVEMPDSGHVALNPGDLRIGYLPQGLEIDPEQSLGQVLRSAYPDPQVVAKKIAILADELAKNPGLEGLQSDYDQALQQMEGLYQVSIGEAESMLAVFGLDKLDRDQPIGHLSGGQKTRLSLALVLLASPQLLLLDEPSNHLDIAMLEWLEDWLRDYQGAFLLVTHDRTLLDRTVNRILDLDPRTHKLSEYQGNYSDYLEEYLAEQERKLAAYKDQAHEIRRMRQDIQHTKQQAFQVEQTTTSREPGVRRYAKKVARKALSREKKLNRYLQSDERVEKPSQGWQMKLEFAGFPGSEDRSQHRGQLVLSLQDLAIGYPGFSPLLQNLNLTVQAKQRIAISGANGSGKTTLLRTIASQLAPRSGKVRLGASVRLGYMSQEQELLDPDLSAVGMIREIAPFNETEVRSFLHYFLFSGDDALRPAGQLSYGERARLILAWLVAGGNNLLLLDEPINHLDIPSRERFEHALAGFEGAVLAVVHDRYFIERFATELWIVENESVRRDVLVIL